MKNQFGYKWSNETFNLNETDYRNSQIKIQSTDYYRTIQSGYAELLGMTNGGDINNSSYFNITEL